MPVLPAPPLKPPRFLFNSHLQTIVPSLFRRITFAATSRERIHTTDGDFLDLDWFMQGAEKLVILSHGLEGDSQRPYMKGMAKNLFSAGFDVLAWNYRGCSGEINKALRSYHSGATDDLEVVIKHVLGKEKYKNMHLAGFSLGGNLTLKYLGEKGKEIYPEIKSAVAISVPCDLLASARKLGTRNNFIYQRRFLKSLRNKVRQKQNLFPEESWLRDNRQLHDFFAFDNFYTAPVHGFANAEEYYKACSSKFFLKNITVPALILNAANDPFLTPDCFPVKEASHSDFLFLEIPEQGGHVGFCVNFGNDEYYSENRALEFIGQTK